MKNLNSAQIEQFLDNGHVLLRCSLVQVADSTGQRLLECLVLQLVEQNAEIRVGLVDVQESLRTAISVSHREKIHCRGSESIFVIYSFLNNENA